MYQFQFSRQGIRGAIRTLVMAGQSPQGQQGCTETRPRVLGEGDPVRSRIRRGPRFGKAHVGREETYKGI